MTIEQIDAYLGEEAQRLNDQYINVPLDFYDGYCWTLHQLNKMGLLTGQHGTWLEMPHTKTRFYLYQCSACHEETLGRQKYCPNCGARMDGVKQ